MEFTQDECRPVLNRLKRARGQLDAVIRMIEDGRDCEDIATQLAAASKAVDRAGSQFLLTGIRRCVATGGAPDADRADADVDADTAALEKLLTALR